MRYPRSTQAGKKMGGAVGGVAHEYRGLVAAFQPRDTEEFAKPRNKGLGGELTAAALSLNALLGWDLW
jgi:hypothetical protein